MIRATKRRRIAFFLLCDTLIFVFSIYLAGFPGSLAGKEFTCRASLVAQW